MLHDADVVRLRHMLDAAVEAIEFMQGRARQELDSNRMLSRAVARDIEIVGEAGSHISAETRRELPAIP